MNDTNRSRKKRRITFTATTEGIERANKALERLFNSKIDYSRSSHISYSKIKEFFNQKPVQADCFQKICEELELPDWKEIAAIEQAEKLKVKEIDCSSSTCLDEGSEPVQTFTRKKTVRDKPNKTVLVVITLQGDINSDLAQETFETILRKCSEKTIEIIDIKQGSIKLFIEGSPEDIKRIVFLIESKEITELSGFTVKEIEIVDENSDAEKTTKSNNKWSLVKEIVNQPVKGRNLSDADLSGANLSSASLSGADLSRADLSNADLSRADLSNADLSDADLSFVDPEGAGLKSGDTTTIKLDISGVGKCQPWNIYEIVDEIFCDD